MKNLPQGWESLFNKLNNKAGADKTTPASNYPAFVRHASNVFAAKSADYDDRYLKALVDLNAFTIWKWEVDKKLDRLRTWLKRGELQVKEEGIRNSVDDLYIYTVQYVNYIQYCVNNGMEGPDFIDLVRADRKVFFESHAKKLSASEWVWFLVNKGLIGEDEVVLQLLIQSYMGEAIQSEEWRKAITTILKG